MTTLIAGALLLLILFVSAGYFFWLLPGGGAAQTVEPVDRHVARWDENEPSAYRYVVRRSCDCAREYLAPYVVSVADGEATAAFPIPVEAAAGGFLETPPAPDTIDEIFEAIRDAAASGFDVSAGYDRGLGYPVAVTIRSPAGARGWEIRDFEVLTGPRN